MSPARAAERSRAATSVRAWSPAGCPNRSLTDLKWSMSTMNNATSPAERRVQRRRTQCEVAAEPDRVEGVARLVGVAELLVAVEAVGGEDGQQVRAEQVEGDRPAADAEDQPQRDGEHRQVHHRVRQHD